MPDIKPITLKLTEWQKRMIRDHVVSLRRKPELDKITISVIDKKQWVMYRQPNPLAVSAGAWNLYLTDAQIKVVARATGADLRISALTLSPEMLSSKAVVFR